jgi:hypothetical protein
LVVADRARNAPPNFGVGHVKTPSGVMTALTAFEVPALGGSPTGHQTGGLTHISRVHQNAPRSARLIETRQGELAVHLPCLWQRLIHPSLETNGRV